jgi:lipid II:glycine glycyltransferase (peptidoglycan interpeptide bridge formation enzyme)
VFTAFAKQNNEVRIKNNEKSKIIDQTPVASVIISFYKEKAIYLFGGSSDEHKNLMAPYLLQWEAINTAKKMACIKYDFFGIAPPNKPNHPWRGVTDFKKKFGGEEIETLGSWDLILQPFEYNLFKIAEKIRR